MISLFRQIIVPLILPRRDKEHEALIKVPIGIMICRGDLCSCGTIPTVMYDLYLCMGRLSPYLLSTTIRRAFYKEYYRRATRIHYLLNKTKFWLKFLSLRLLSARRNSLSFGSFYQTM